MEKKKESKPATQGKKENQSLLTYVLMFTLAGHKTWRTSFYPTKKYHDIYLSKQINHPEILQKKWFIVDRINGTITEEK